MHKFFDPRQTGQFPSNQVSQLCSVLNKFHRESNVTALRKRGVKVIQFSRLHRCKQHRLDRLHLSQQLPSSHTPSRGLYLDGDFLYFHISKQLESSVLRGSAGVLQKRKIVLYVSDNSKKGRRRICESFTCTILWSYQPALLRSCP